MVQTADKALSALIYSPNEMTAKVANGTMVTFKEGTNYPFEEAVKFTLGTAGRDKSVSFPFHLRIPEWCTGAEIKVNGQLWKEVEGTLKE